MSGRNDLIDRDGEQKAADWWILQATWLESTTSPMLERSNNFFLSQKTMRFMTVGGMLHQPGRIHLLRQPFQRKNKTRHELRLTVQTLTSYKAREDKLVRAESNQAVD